MGATMRGVERQEEIKSYIHASKGRVSVSDLSNRWGITQETVRRDLDKLEEQGFVTRVYGGAIWNSTVSRSGVRFMERRSRQSNEKELIALKAAHLANGCSSIAVDASSTALGVLRAMDAAPSLKVVTSSVVPFLDANEQGFELISSGGQFNSSTLAFQGETAVQSILRFHVNLALIGCAALDLSGRVTDSNEDEVQVKRAIIQAADRVAVLADHTKFDRVAFLDLVSLSEVSYLVTDERPSQEWVDRCEELGVELLY